MANHARTLYQKRKAREMMNLLHFLFFHCLWEKFSNSHTTQSLHGERKRERAIMNLGPHCKALDLTYLSKKPSPSHLAHRICCCNVQLQTVNHVYHQKRQ